LINHVKNIKITKDGDNILVRFFSNPEVINFYQFPIHIIINNSIYIEQSPENAKYYKKKEIFGLLFFIYNLPNHYYGLQIFL